MAQVLSFFDARPKKPRWQLEPFLDAVAKAPKGYALRYYVGDLAFDRQADYDLRNVAEAALILSESDIYIPISADVVEAVLRRNFDFGGRLVQRKIQEFVYEYLFVKEAKIKVALT